MLTKPQERNSPGSPAKETQMPFKSFHSKSNKPKSYSLDNAATIYPAARTRSWSATFRMGAILKEEVRPDVLAQAVDDLSLRFPYYYVQLKQGLFWYRLRGVPDTDLVVREADYPCRPLKIGGSKKPLFRVVYFKKRVAVEFFHALTDGTGASVYLKSLLARYFTLLGYQIPCTQGVLSPDDTPEPDEAEDSYQSLYRRSDRGTTRREDAAYQYNAPSSDDYLRVVHGLIPVDALKRVTKEKGVTITEYLVAVYLYSFYQDIQKRREELGNLRRKPIKISVPANLRPMFGSQTMRNFALFANVGIDPQKDYTFDEILREASQKLHDGLDKEKLRRAASRNVADARMAISRFSPNFLKSPVLKLSFHLFGERLFTSPFSNLGVIRVPPEMEPLIDRFEMIIGRTAKNIIYCTAITYRNLLNVTFSSTSDQTDIQRYFLTFLTAQGIDVRVESNIP